MKIQLLLLKISKDLFKTAVLCYLTFTGFNLFAQGTPVFDPNPNDTTVQCLEDVPAQQVLTASSDCEPVEVTPSSFHTGAVLDSCALTTALGDGADWSIWLPGLEENGLAPSEYWHFQPGAHLKSFEGNTAHINGIIVNSEDPSLMMEVNFWFHNGMGWNAWSDLGRDYKDDLDMADPFYQDWDYYEMVPGISTMTGIGALAGSELFFAHSPANFYYGFQCGIAANDRNTNEGMSGWFSFSGTFAGEPVSGPGDLNVDKDCSTPNTSTCVNHDEFTYLWHAVDTCGNMANAEQVITVNDTTEPVFTVAPSNETVSCEDWPLDVPSDLEAEDNCDSGILELVYVGEFIESESACESLYIRRWTATDLCDNTATFEQYITVIDEVAPVFDNTLTDVTIECDEDIPTEMLTATDNCTVATVNLVETSDIISTCTTIFTRTFTATDSCGNDTVFVQTITIEDTTAPVFDEYEETVYVPCDEDVDVPALTATDNCSIPSVEFIEVIDESVDCGGLITRTYTATDECGLTTEATQTIILVDEEAPELTVPADQTVECDNVPMMPSIDEAEVTDNCDANVTVEVNETIVSGMCEDNYTITWYWTAYDACNNTTNDSTVITVVDTIDPTWVDGTIPANVTYECSEEIPTPIMPEAVDNCDTNVDVVMTEVTLDGDCPNNYTIQRIYRGFDNCGNDVIAMQIVTVEDTTPPVFDPFDSLEMPCDDIEDGIFVTATDNCSEVTITVIDEMIDEGCAGQILKTYTATDECGNSSTATQTVVLIDDVAPVFDEFEPSLEEPCDEAYDAIYVTATDNCTGVTITVDNMYLSGGCAFTMIKTYTATDGCGNTSTIQQVISLIDNEAPVFVTFPEDINLECDMTIPTMEEGEADITIDDNCTEPTLSYEGSQTILGDCPQNYTITHTWKVIDECDNEYYRTWTISIEDTTIPVFTYIPESILLDCADDTPDSIATADDNCGTVTVTSEDVIEGNSCLTTITRTFTAEDECGNMAYATQTITKEDTTAPELTVGDDMSLECDETIPEPESTVSDDCSTADVVVTSETIDGDCPQSYTMIRTYTATDSCGNETILTQTLTITDSTDPVFTSVPENVTIDCAEELPTDLATAEDNCDAIVDVMYEDDVTGDACEYIITRTFTAIDDCGNSVTAEQVITQIDNTPPTLTVGEDMTFECDEMIPDATYTASDDCNEYEVVITTDTIDGACPQAYEMTRTFVATDACGNSVTETQTITVTDTTAPNFTFVPTAITIECDEEIPTEMATADDNCGDVTVTYEDEMDGDSCDMIITRTFTAIDECDNSTTETQLITVSDTTPPVFTYIPESIILDCADDTPDSIATADDNCGTVTVTSEDVIEGNSCLTTITRTFTAEDECGNMAYATQTITKEDTTAPELTVGDDMSLECDETIPEPESTVSDDCSAADVVVTSETIDGDCPQSYTMIRTYTATDSCGNETVLTQTLTITDSTDPVFTSVPENVTIDCAEELPTDLATAEDNCDAIVDVMYEDDVTGDACEYIITRTFTAIDDCGNSVTAEQVITQIDNTPPTLTVGEDMTFECDEMIPDATYTASDDCNEYDVVIITDTIDGACPQAYELTRTFVATDACGNSVTETQTITVTDTTAPNFTFVPTAITIECDEEIPTEMATADDNCGDVTVTYEDEMDGDSCDMIITRTFTAIDECDNSTTETQLITVQDTTAPTLTIGEDMTITCEETVPEAESNALDNCNTTTVSVDETTEGGDYCYVITRIYIATDSCGNSSLPMTQTITVTDNVAPVINEEPTDVSYVCPDDVPDFESWTATDNCDPNPSTSTEWDYLSQDDCGNYVATVTCTATDACGNSSSTSFMVTVEDTVAPTFDEVLEDLVLDCDDTVPAPEDLMGTDNCSGDLTYSTSDNVIGDLPNPNALLDCDATTPTSDYYDVDWGMIFINVGVNSYFTIVDANFLEFPNGTAHLTATMMNTENNAGGFFIDVWFENGMDWANWSTQSFPTSYKDDYGTVGDNYLDWTYYILNGDMAIATGWGDYAGSALTFSHAPANYFYGFQIGVGANNVSTNYGGGGWFNFQGTFIDASTSTNETVTGSGDFAWDSDCCPDYMVERIFCVMDCSENETCFTQLITFEDLDGIVGGVQMGNTIVEQIALSKSFDFVSVSPNPIIDYSLVEFRSNINVNLKMELFDSFGNHLEYYFNELAEKNTTFRKYINTSDLPAGMYTLRLSSNDEITSRRIVVLK